MKLKIAFGLTAVISLAVPLAAADVVELMSTEPEYSARTGKNMYDLERCMIEADAPAMPFVYRQPDRPQQTLIVWDGGDGVGGVSAAARLEGLENTKLTFWGREKILRRISPCFESAAGT